MPSAAASVLICEMSPRDGLQFLGAGSDPPRLVPTDRKIELIAALQSAGLRFIEVTAFVSPQVTPQMADAEPLAVRLAPADGVQQAALVPNIKHYQRMRFSRLNTVSLFVSASEEYSLKNTGAPLAQTLDWAREIAQAARADGRRLRAHVSGAFQDVYSATPSDVDALSRVIEALLTCGCEHVALADTNGDTNPQRVRTVLGEVSRRFALSQIAVHLHDRGGCGIANALAAFDAGVRIFDASVGSVGGSTKALRDDPSGGGSAAARGVAGNVATEELVELFERMGTSTGVDRTALASAGQIIYEITQQTGDPAPPSRWLREQLGYRSAWVQ